MIETRIDRTGVPLGVVQAVEPAAASPEPDSPTPERGSALRVAPRSKFSFGSQAIAFGVLAGIVAIFGAAATFSKVNIYTPVILVGLAVALQKYVASFFGFYVMRFSSIFSLGDRIRIGAIKGDVKKIGLLHFVLEEVGDDEKLGGELTGRILHIPNLVILDQAVLNYSKSHSVGNKLLACDYVFDEVRIPLALTSNVERAAQLLNAVLRDNDREAIQEAKAAFPADYPEFLQEAERGPRVFVHIEAQRLWLKGKFVCPVRNRNYLRSQLLREFMIRLRRETDIQLA